MNSKRIIIASSIGLLCGLFCAYGTVMMQDQMNFEITTALLASIIYQRILLGFVVGIGNHFKITPAIRGALLGITVGLAMGIMSLVDGDLGGGMMLLGFSAVYGAIIDVVATKFS